MKFKLQAGADLELLTKEEVRDVVHGVMQDWVQQAMIGPKMVEVYAQGTVTSAGALTIGGESADLTAGNLGPQNGMLWSVKWTNVYGLQGADTLAMYKGPAVPSRLVRTDVAGYQRYGSDELVVRGGTNLQFAGTGLATPAGTVVVITGHVWELPQTMMYKLL